MARADMPISTTIMIATSTIACPRSPLFIQYSVWNTDAAVITM